MLTYVYDRKIPILRNNDYQKYHDNLFSMNVKTNPDIHYSKQYRVFTLDRLYGQKVLPKRPWEAFKNPEETMKRVAYRHNRVDIRY